jgi:hypothetical protein
MEYIVEKNEKPQGETDDQRISHEKLFLGW